MKIPIWGNLLAANSKTKTQMFRYSNDTLLDSGVFAYVEKEDTPRPLVYQLDLLRRVGFAQVEVLHKHVYFAAFGAVKASTTN